MTASTEVADFRYVGPTRDLRISYGNGLILDKRNDAETQTISGTNPGYDMNGRHIRHEWEDIFGVQITAYVNTYNGAGGLGTNRRKTETRERLSGHQDTYTFDSMYRMIEFDRNSGAVGLSTRTLDGANKMTAFIDEGLDQMPQVDQFALSAENGMNQYSKFGGPLEWVYDQNANLENNRTYKYLYDYQNRLVEIRNQIDTVIAEYTYTADNRRVLRDEALLGKVTRYIYKGWQVLEERDVSTPIEDVLRQYVDGRSLDEHIQLKDYTRPFEPVFYYHGNAQGFVGALTDENRVIQEYYEYSWLGKPTVIDPATMLPFATPDESSIGNPYMFQGRRYDPEANLYYYRNRYYSPETGEFITIDPIGNWNHGHGNGYAAFGGDPWNISDPMGLYSFSEFLTCYDEFQMGTLEGVGEAAWYTLKSIGSMSIKSQLDMLPL